MISPTFLVGANSDEKKVVGNVLYEREAHWPFLGEHHKAVITALTGSQPDIKVISSLDTLDTSIQVWWWW